MTRTLADLCEAAGINLMSVNPSGKYIERIGRAVWITFMHDELGTWAQRNFGGSFGASETIKLTSSQFVTLRVAGIQFDTPLHLDSPI